MKKSTILVVALVYIVSFLIVGLFGLSIRAIDIANYVEDIIITVPEQGLKYEDLTEKDQPGVDGFSKAYQYRYRTSFTKEGMVVQFKAEVKPVDTDYKEIRLQYNTAQTVFKVEKVDNNYINLTFLSAGTAKFSVYSTDGKDFHVDVQMRAKVA